jgi:CRP-like cAMP-binding protein
VVAEVLLAPVAEPDPQNLGNLILLLFGEGRVENQGAVPLGPANQVVVGVPGASGQADKAAGFLDGVVGHAPSVPCEKRLGQEPDEFLRPSYIQNMEITLAEHIRRFTAFSKQEEERLGEIVDVRTLVRKEHLFQAGEDAGQLAFVERGLLRLYSVSGRAKETTLQFGLEGWWLADWDGFEGRRPSQFHLQAVEESRIAVISRDGYEPLFAALPSLERYFRRVYQRAHGAAQRRIHLTATSSGEEMYRQFQRRYPDFVQRVPQYMLASFLGFTPEFLSKIRAKRT